MKKITKPLIRLFLMLLFASQLMQCADRLENEEMNTSFSTGLDAQLSQALDLMDSDASGALEICAKVINESGDLGLIGYSGKAKWYMGYIYDDLLQDKNRAYFYYNESIKDLKETSDYSLLHSVYLNLGELNRINGQTEKAVKLYEDALNFKEEYNDSELSELYYNYGVALKLQGTNASFTEAQKAIETSLTYALEAGDSRSIARVNNQIGLMYKDVGNYDMARIAYNNTIKDAVSDTEILEFAGYAYHGIGVTYMEEGKWEEAARAFNKALEYKTDSRSIFVSKYDLGTVLMKAGRTDIAIDTWKEALKEDYNKNSIEHVKIYSQLTKALSAGNQHEEALAFAEIYNDNIQNILDGTEVATGNDQLVMFEDIVREYEEFVAPSTSFYLGVSSYMLIAGMLSLLLIISSILYIRYRNRTEESVAYHELKARFEQFKVD